MRIGLQSAIKKICKVMNEPVFVVDEEGVIKYKNALSHSIFQQLCIDRNFTLFYPDMKNWHYFYHYLVKRKKNNCQDIPILNDRNQLYYMNLNIIEFEQTGMFLIKILSSKSELQLSSQKALAYNNLMRVFNDIKQAVILTDFSGNILTYNDVLENLLNISIFKEQFNYFEQLFDQFDYSLSELTDYYKSIGQHNFGELTIQYNNKDHDCKNIKVISVVYKDLDILVTTLYVQGNDQFTSHPPPDLGIRLLGENTAKILHEINNPLTSLKGYVDLMVKKEEFNIGYLNIIQQELQKIEVLTSDLLKLSNPRNDKYESISIISLVEECIDLISVEAHRNDCEISIHIDVDQDSFIFVNKIRIQQVILNILKNSIEAIGENNSGVMNIIIKKVLNQFRISITDNGPGINKENLDKIFNSFFTTKDGGTGLGLSISKQLIEEHNGKLLVDSEEGVGTTFSVYIPVHMPIIPTNYYQQSWLHHNDFDNA